jgi:cytochrome c-type biogenesis protein CcmH/NrfF
MSARRVAVAVAAIVLVGMAAAGLLRAAAATGPASEAQRVEAIAATLRCPTCQGLSVADSPSKVANGMRDIIAEQLAAGQSPEQIQAWFVERYGEWILLSPPPSGLGWAVWLLPVVALAVGVVAAVAVARRGARSQPPVRALRSSRALRWAGAGAAFFVAVAIALVAALGPRGADGLPTGDTADSSQQQAAADDLARLRAAVEREPGDVTARVQLAAALLRAGRPAEVPEHLQPVLDDHPDEPDAILLLGIAQIQQGDPSAPTTLERYLEVAPDDHEGRPVAEELLGGP